MCSVSCRMLFSDGMMGARIDPNRRVWKMVDISLADLLAVVGEVKGLISRRFVE